MLLAALALAGASALVPGVLRSPLCPRTAARTASVVAVATELEVIVSRLESGSLGIDVDSENAVATNNGQPDLLVGDVITAIDGETLDGRAAGSVLTPGAPQYTFTISRDPSRTAAMLENVLLQLAGDTAVASSRLGIYSYEDCQEGLADKAKAMISTLEGTMDHSVLSANDVRDRLIGFWKLVLVSDSEFARSGVSGYGDLDSCSAMGSFQCFTAPGTAPYTAQVVEVVGNTGSGSAQLAALKGDFECAAGDADSAAVVTEKYSKSEYEGLGQEGVPATESKMTISFLGASLRVSRSEDGTVRLYERMDAGAAQAEISSLMATPVSKLGSESAGFGDMPLWERRLREDRERPSYDGPGTYSDIP